MCSKSNINILIIEDEAIVALDLKSKITAMGFNIVGSASSGSCALGIMEKNRVNLAIIDISIKGSQNGIEIASIINEKYKIPFIFITAHSERSIIDKCMRLNPFGYLVKPFQERDLAVSIHVALNNYFVLNNKQISVSKLNDISKSNIIINLDSKGNIISCNDFALKLLGYSFNELSQLSFVDIIIPEQQYKSKSDIIKILRENKIHFNYELIDKDNNTFRVFGVAELIHKSPDSFEIHTISHIVDEYYFFKDADKKQGVIQQFSDEYPELIFN